MNVLETEWWTLLVPPEWWAEQEQDSVLVGDRDNVGCIEFSTLHKQEGQFGDGEVEQLARAESEQTLQWAAVSLGDFSGVTAAYREEDDAIREWYVADGALLLFITYSCGEDNAGMDDAAVDEILDTLLRVS
jgi:hypothetical protein